MTTLVWRDAAWRPLRSSSRTTRQCGRHQPSPSVPSPACSTRRNCTFGAASTKMPRPSSLKSSLVRCAQHRHLLVGTVMHGAFALKLDSLLSAFRAVLHIVASAFRAVLDSLASAFRAVLDSLASAFRAVLDSLCCWSRRKRLVVTSAPASCTSAAPARFVTRSGGAFGGPNVASWRCAWLAAG